MIEPVELERKRDELKTTVGRGEKMEVRIDADDKKGGEEMVHSSKRRRR